MRSIVCSNWICFCVWFWRMTWFYLLSSEAFRHRNEDVTFSFVLLHHSNGMQFSVVAKPQHTFLLACCLSVFFTRSLGVCVCECEPFQMTRWTGSYFQLCVFNSILWIVLSMALADCDSSTRWKWNSPHQNDDGGNSYDNDDDVNGQ